MSSQDATDIFSLTDAALADRLQFIKEIGFGNWGSVWLCSPKDESEEHTKLAVKLVHRSKTTTTAARVRSLWNEMKIVRTLKKDAHPSIVPFHSFIITPSYALITMDYLPQLVPVEVPEVRGKEWLHSLLDAVAFLHRRGVVHNDIKPANILLSSELVPVLVDFGFAEKYDTKSAQAFHSNLTYGTPEYLSPERARGLPHDTRKADVWALGVTFFEILVGRTPFEAAEGESFTTKEDLEKYWQRTVRGKWVGTWKMSKAAERLLRRMVQPNADLRCFAAEALNDTYWTHDRETVSSMHKRAASAAATPTHKRTGSAGLLDIISPWATRRLSKDAAPTRIPTATASAKPSTSRLAPKAKANPSSATSSLRPRSLVRKESNISAKLVRRESIASSMATGAPRKDSLPEEDEVKEGAKEVKEAPRSKSALGATSLHGHGRSQSQLVTSTSRMAAVEHPSPIVSKRLAPIPGSPASARRTTNRNKENSSTLSPGQRRKPIPSTLSPVTRKAVGGASKPVGLAPKSAAAAPSGLPPAGHRRTGALADVTSRTRNRAPVDAPAEDLDRDDAASAPAGDITANTSGTGNASNFTDEGKSLGSVRNRMREWERVREAMRRGAETADPQPADAPESAATPAFQLEPATPVRGLRAASPISDGVASPILIAKALESESEQEYQSLSRPALHAFRPTHARSRTPEPSMPASPLSPDMNFDLFQDSVSAASPEQSVGMGESGLSILRQSFKASIDRSFNLYKTSLGFGRGFSRRPSTSASERVPDLTIAELGSRMDASWNDSAEKEGYEDANASLAVVRQARRNERAGADARTDRMTLWLQNVERVVEDARQNFAASTSSPLPPLPLAPVRSSSRNREAGASASFRNSQRVPRKILAASKIFTDASFLSTTRSPNASNGPSQTTQPTSVFASPTSYVPNVDDTLPTIPSESFVESPRRTRRATVVGMSPEKSRNLTGALEPSVDDVTSSPSKRKEKSRSQNDLQLQRAIQPRARLTLELDRMALAGAESGPPSSRRLSAYVDRDAFKSSTSSTPAPTSLNFDLEPPRTPLLEAPHTPTRRLSLTPPVANSIMASPFEEIKPYPARTVAAPAVDTPTARRIEGVYDRFLMATSGVRRHGRGYEASTRGGPLENQSSAHAPVEHLVSNTVSSPAAPARPPIRLFNSARRAMPPPVSSSDVFDRKSEDMLRARALKDNLATKENLSVNRSVDELGLMRPSQRGGAATPGGTGKGTNTVKTVRNAFKAIVRRPSSRLV